MSDAASVRTQILVVGSGAGGAVTAATFAEAGYEVLLLEEGDTRLQLLAANEEHRLRFTVPGNINAEVADGLLHGVEELVDLVHVVARAKPRSAE